MKTLSLLTVAPLLLSAGIFVLPSTPQPTVPGPGSVIHAVEGFVQAIAAGDREYLQKALAEMHRGQGIACGFDAKTGKMSEQAVRTKLPFRDVAVDGSVINATDEAGAVDALIESWGKKDLQAKTRMISVLAGCPGPTCCWASVDFERSFLRGKERVVLPMQATVLVRYTDDEPRMKIFLWHSSLAPAAAAKTVSTKNEK